MMRRRLCGVGASPFLFLGSRSQTGGRQNNDGSRLHQFIREEQASSQQHGGGKNFNAPSTPSSAPPPTDWTERLQQELYSEVDPLGGQAHKDFFRDPATGYAPGYAPRNFASGGEVGYTHPVSDLHYREGAARRSYTDHDVSRMQEEARHHRDTIRGLSSPGERRQYLRQQVPSDRFASHIPTNESTAVLDELHFSGAMGAENRRRQTTLDRHAVAAEESGVSFVAGTLPRRELDDLTRQQYGKIVDDALDEHLRINFGLRAKERFDFQVRQRSSRLQFPGYDSDRMAAQQKGTPYGATQLPPGIPASSMEEAQRHLRENTVPDYEAQVKERFAANTVTSDPKLGEALTQDVVYGLRSAEKAKRLQEEKDRKQRFGLGRQGALVQDMGPDKRQLKKNTNDERLLDAMVFASNAYRRTAVDEHVDPYQRGDTQQGVGHLLGNRFDIERREDRISKGEPDLTERSMMHYGTPVQQSIDDFVFRHRNARGERPLDYYSPFPNFRALRLYQVYEDTEGFPLMRQRPEFLEWELFTRYRAHHQQRRELALLHGLEPVLNETAQERDARRLKLDILCEKTPFEPTRITLLDDQKEVDVGTLRRWFGAYMLPSPTIVQAVVDSPVAMGLYGQLLPDELGTEDTREHLLSSRYINKLLPLEGYFNRLRRGGLQDVSGKAPQPVIKYAQPPTVLKHFSREEQIMYNQYVQSETEKQMERWQRIQRSRRYLPHKEQYAEVINQGSPTAVVDTVTENGEILTIATGGNFTKAMDEVRKGHKKTILVDGKECLVQLNTQRTVVPLQIKLEFGEVLETTDEDYSQYPLEEAASATYNHALDYGVVEYTYNRGNYVETQDVLWERHTAEGQEGWSPATPADGLRPGLPVRARRSLGVPDPVEGAPHVVGDYQRAKIVSYYPQPFFNPGERRVTVQFQSDGREEEVFVKDVLIWQRQYHGPERTVGEETHRYNPAGLRRYVDVTDPDHAKERSTPSQHFLDKYNVHNPEEQEAKRQKLRATKQITEIDQWTAYDLRRPENYRPLSISHRRDYVRRGYMPRYTPWEWILTQEADQPLIKETIRSDNVGPSSYFSLNRYWRYKARPHGYIRHYDNEVRDLFQFVDGVTPWKQAQKIRTYWEVREHHPMPQFHRPEVAMHRNTAGLLPAHLWETDKKTGKVKGVKDSVRDYQTKTAVPSWVQL